MISNWLVKTKQIKKGLDGLVRHSNYLLSCDRPAHYKTKIMLLFGSAENIVNAHSKRKELRQKQGLRGGGIRNYATSFVMSLPSDVGHPTVSNWKSSMREVFEGLESATGIDKRVLFKHSMAVLHNESESGKCSHIHLLISNVIVDKYIKKLTQYQSTHNAKQGFNKGIKRTLGISNYDYTPKFHNLIDKPLWLARKEKKDVEDQISKERFDLANERRSKAREVQRNVRKLGKVMIAYGKNLKRWFESQEQKEEIKYAKKMQKQIDDLYSYGFNGEQLVDIIEATRIAEKKKSKKTGLKLKPSYLG
jgi:hypothetical protein